ncbi:Clock-controlled pheromone ccg-4, partial [Colletotrichum sp. SAR11_59]
MQFLTTILVAAATVQAIALPDPVAKPAPNPVAEADPWCTQPAPNPVAEPEPWCTKPDQPCWKRAVEEAMKREALPDPEPVEKPDT